MKKSEIYKCGDCGNVVELVGVGGGDLSCCGKAMDLLTEKTADAATEKHVPVVEQTDNGILVKVGSVPHPMTAEHSIQWIEVINGDYSNRKYLNPEGAAEAEFYVPLQQGLIVREFCNLHGLWKNEL